MVDQIIKTRPNSGVKRSVRTSQWVNLVSSVSLSILLKSMVKLGLKCWIVILRSQTRVFFSIQRMVKTRVWYSSCVNYISIELLNCQSVEDHRNTLQYKIMNDTMNKVV